ncbi:MAG: hypothetical protein HAW62_05530 [Endozoicomonadaceae bacterium]|nr:hypothetical protein [Endozoicomonadaceae bacterium]
MKIKYKIYQAIRILMCFMLITFFNGILAANPVNGTQAHTLKQDTSRTEILKKQSICQLFCSHIHLDANKERIAQIENELIAKYNEGYANNTPDRFICSNSRQQNDCDCDQYTTFCNHDNTFCKAYSLDVHSKQLPILSKVEAAQKFEGELIYEENKTNYIESYAQNRACHSIRALSNQVKNIALYTYHGYVAPFFKKSAEKMAEWRQYYFTS